MALQEEATADPPEAKLGFRLPVNCIDVLGHLG